MDQEYIDIIESELLIWAVEHYIACMDSGDMSEPDKGGFITENEFDERLEQAKKDIRITVLRNCVRQAYLSGTCIPDHEGIS